MSCRKAVLSLSGATKKEPKKMRRIILTNFIFLKPRYGTLYWNRNDRRSPVAALHRWEKKIQKAQYAHSESTVVQPPAMAQV
jgi:hypothetical protein